MFLRRVIPVLLLDEARLVKTIRFSTPSYVGDPLNAVRIFNEKEVNELMVLDIRSSTSGTEVNYELIGQIAGECFMPLVYGGGIKSLGEIGKLLRLGVEKVAVNTSFFSQPGFIQSAVKEFGSSTIIVSIDCKKNFWGKHEVMLANGQKKTGLDPVEMARKAEAEGAGEILINSVDQDGTMNGYDLQLTGRVASAVNVPVIACGGAGKMEHFSGAIRSGASAVAAGSMFVYQGVHRAVLINYLSEEEIIGLGND